MCWWWRNLESEFLFTFTFIYGLDVSSDISVYYSTLYISRQFTARAVSKIFNKPSCTVPNVQIDPIPRHELAHSERTGNREPFPAHTPSPPLSSSPLLLSHSFGLTCSLSFFFWLCVPPLHLSLLPTLPSIRSPWLLSPSPSPSP